MNAINFQDKTFQKMFFHIMKKVFNEFEFEPIEIMDFKCVLSNKKCVLTIYNEFSDLFCEINEYGNNEPKFHLGLMLFVFHGQKIKMHTEVADYIKKIELQLEEISQNLLLYFENVLKGDFSWKAQYQEFHEHQKELQKGIHDLGKDHPRPA